MRPVEIPPSITRNHVRGREPHNSEDESASYAADAACRKRSLASERMLCRVPLSSLGHVGEWSHAGEQGMFVPSPLLRKCNSYKRHNLFYTASLHMQA